MNTKFLSIALITTVISIKAQQIQTRPASPFNKVETHGSVNVIYTSSDTLDVQVSAAAKEIDNVETKFENSTLIVNNKGHFSSPVYVYVKNSNLIDVQSSGASTFKTSNIVKCDSINFSLSGSSEVSAKLECQSIKSIQSGASNLKLMGSSPNLFAELSGASTLKSYDLSADKVNVSTTGASSAKIYVNEKLIANASGASNIKIKGDAKDISAEASPAASITKTLDQNKVEKSSGKDSTVYKWKGKKIIIIDKDKDGETSYDTVDVKHKHANEEFYHWAGFSMGINGYLGANGSTTLQKGVNYMDLDYSRSYNFQFNIIERQLNIVRNNLKLVTGFGFDYHSYGLNRNTNLNPNTDSLPLFASVDTTNNYDYKKNKFRNTYIQVPLLLEFNTSNNPNKSFHMAFGVIGEFLISSRTKQKLEQNGFEFTKQKRDSYNLNPFSAKAHVNIGYRGFTAFGEYNLTPLFQSGKGPELYPFTVGVRLIPFD
ncbi:MAG: DUF2807 domain-containing protein [Bacteroidota bacterium]|nr:DUF2807 domain-containing protein [Bacteroidota bacterium]MDP3144658.1 DUF2807 domain-containing protein [Bacteroidota bacterium]